MSLVKKPMMTEGKLAASQRNGALSQGPATPEGKERNAAAHLRHGFYARADDVVGRGLGEDRAQFEELYEGLRDEFTPRGTLQEELVNRLARVWWLIRRTDRALEGAALRRARSADSGRDIRLHARLMRLKMTAGSLQSLARSVAVEHYVTRPTDLELMKGLQQEPELPEMGEIAVALFVQLQDPGSFDEFGRPTDSIEQQKQVLMRIKEIFGLANDQPASAPGSSAEAGDPPAPIEKPNPYPHIRPEQWEEREPVRQLLENILTHQAEECEAMRKALRKEVATGPSPYELAAEAAPGNAEALLSRRVQDANIREVRRITSLLWKMKRQEGKMEAAEPCDDGAETHDVTENKES